jgi:coenzyme PQQ precursor peptide PqqA
MMALIHPALQQRRMLPGSTRRRLTMKWETPTAIDLRFGMEITMYIANR